MTPDSITPHVPDIAADVALISESRDRMRGAQAVKDQRSALLAGGSFLVVALGWLALAPPVSIPFGALTWCVLAYVVAASVEFEIGPGCALPTAPFQVVMLFVLPPELVPVAVALGLALAAVVAWLRDPEREERVMVVAASGWPAVGPAAVFAVAGVAGRPAVADLPVYVIALGAQFALGAGVAWLRNCYGLGVPERHVANALTFTFLCDVALAPLGFAAVLAVPGSASALLVLLPPTLLLAVLQSDRRRQVDHLVALGAAFKRTNALARRDALTGLSNRLAWEETIDQLARSHTPVAVVLADVDGLKAANDTRGHETGDRLLTTVADILADATPAARGADAFRIGGDEFAILLPRASAASVDSVVSNLRSALETAPAIDGVVNVSASVGAGFAAAGATLAAAVAEADQHVNADKTARGARRA